MGTSGQQGQTLAQFGCGLDIDIWPTDADRLFQSKRILFLPVLCDFCPQTFVELLRSSRKRNKRESPFLGHTGNVFAPIFFRRTESFPSHGKCACKSESASAEARG